MAILPIVQYPDPRLSTVAKPVTVFDEELKSLAADMAETMYDAPGVGLAAPQVGKLIRLVVIDVTDSKDHLLTLVNPEVTPIGTDKTEYDEGCLSLPDVYEKVSRPSKVHVKAQNLAGEFFEMDCDGLLAVCVQHETDHLNGMVFIDHLSQLKKNRAATKLVKLRREKARKAKENRS